MLLVMPEFSPGSFASFGRLQPLHLDLAIFGFCGNGIFAAVYYSTQRLCKARMWSDILSKFHFWGWQMILIAASITLPLGITQGKQFAEFEWPIDIAIAMVWFGLFSVNFFMTLLRRRERRMYVSLWFYIATVVIVAIIHVGNNIVVPLNFFKSVCASRRRSGRDGSSVVQPEFDAVLVDDAVPWADVLLSAQGCGATGVFLQIMHCSILAAGDSRRLGGA